MLDAQVLGEFKETLAERAPEVLGWLQAGVSEDEVHSKFAAIGVTASSDAVAWWGSWNTRPITDGEARSESFLQTYHPDVLPGWQFIGLDDSVRGTQALRDTAAEVTHSISAGPGGEAGAALGAVSFRETWVALLASGGNANAILDCAAPTAPSAVRECWSETFSGSVWGRVLCDSLARWIKAATERLHADDYHYNPQTRLWLSPREDWTQQSSWCC